MIVIDTNVLSELMKPGPAPVVVEWVSARPVSSLYTTSITEAEIHFGVALLPAGKRRRSLEEAVAKLFEDDFRGRILPFDSEAARAFGLIAASRRQAGRPITQLDAQIVAIASSRGAAVATRNIDDFSDCGVPLHNPWVP